LGHTVAGIWKLAFPNSRNTYINSTLFSEIWKEKVSKTPHYILEAAAIIHQLLAV